MIVETDPSPLSYDAIATYAERVAEAHSIHKDGAADLDRLLEILGGKVETSDSFFGDESLRVRSHGDFTVVLPALTSARRDRFTIAHELGHYFVHYLADDAAREAALEKRFTRGGRNRAETQANVFAASLLMPREAFKTARAKFGDDWDKLAHHFGVSARAAQVRAEVVERA